MSIINDISSLIRKGPEMAAELNSIKMNTKSVVKGANDATFQFPCLMSDTIPIDYANTTVRMLDRVYADFTQIWISMNPIMDMTLDPTPMSYLRRLHQNAKMESTEIQSEDVDMDTFLERAYNGEDRLYLNEDKNFGVIFSGTDKVTTEMVKNNREGLNAYMSEFDMRPIYEADSDNTNAYDLASAIIDGKMKKMEDTKRSDKLKESDRSRSPQLLDREVKKTNDMTPYGIQVRLIATNDKKEFVQYIDFIIGVKAVLHPIKSDDMMDNIQRALQNKSTFFKFLRWTTGEISLVKDLILNMNEIKTDAANVNNGKSPWFGTLKRLKKRRFGVHDLTVPHAMIPNTTIVISSAESDYLESHGGINLRNPSVAKKLVKALFLVGFIIIDDATGTIDILYDGSDSFQTYSLDSIDRENSLSSNKLGKEIGRMISR